MISLSSSSWGEINGNGGTPRKSFFEEILHRMGFTHLYHQQTQEWPQRNGAFRSLYGGFFCKNVTHLSSSKQGTLSTVHFSLGRAASAKLYVLYSRFKTHFTQLKYHNNQWPHNKFPRIRYLLTHLHVHFMMNGFYFLGT